jgi:hypothetical protein
MFVAGLFWSLMLYLFLSRFIWTEGSTIRLRVDTGALYFFDAEGVALR